MSDAATPAATPTEAPVVPAATPASNAAETVTLTKEQHDQLARDAARAASNQRKADLYDRVVGKNGNGHFRAPAPAPATPPADDGKGEDWAAAEDRKAERGLLSLAVDPSLREVLDADPTLREMITKNPLAVLPILAPDALDAEDAVNLVKGALESRKKPSTPPATPPATPATPPAPPAGGVNPQNKEVDEAVERARKNPNTENAIAGMIKARASGMK